MENAIQTVLDTVMRDDHGRLVAALARRLGDVQLAEDCLQEALVAALEHWARSGQPGRPDAWLLRVAHRRAIDRFRRDARFRSRHEDIALLAEDEMALAERPDIPDERLRLIFTCCHPALESKTRVALTLRLIGGLNTDEIAHAFLDKPSAMAQRLSRAKKKIAAARIPFVVPEGADLDIRVQSVLSVIYLIFNEGYLASSGDLSVRTDLCQEAVFLARLLDQLCPDEPEILGILSLMLTTQARFPARQSNVTIPLTQQDRGLWDRALIAEGEKILDRAIALGRAGPYQVKAAISALHVSAPDQDSTDWAQILLLYDRLLQFEPSPVVRLNRAVVLAESGALDQALREFDDLSDELKTYQPFHAAQAQFRARAGQIDGARQAYRRAIELAGNQADRDYLIGQKQRLLKR